MKTDVDLILRNATIYTVDSVFSTAQSIAVKNGKIMAIGSDKEIQGGYRSEHEVDLSGKFLYPGFIDAHCHFYGYGTNLMRNIDLVGTRSFDEVLRILADKHREHPGEWLLGRGWDQNDWPVKEFPDNKRLDSLFPDIPVYLRRIDGHAALANSEALRRAGITPDRHIRGGEVEVKNGNMTGILLDNAMDLISGIIPEMTVDEKTHALLSAQKNCLAVGLTTVVDAGLDKSTIMIIDSLHKAQLLKIRVDAMLTPSEKNLEAFLPGGIYQTDRLRVGSIKLYADGALGSRGGCLFEPYSDAPDRWGIMVNEPAYFNDLCQRAHKAGYQVNTHAIGDSAVRMILNTYAAFLEGKNDRRWRIEHSQVVHPDDFHLFGDYSIIPSVQATHATSDMVWALERLGSERIKGAFAYKQLLDQNGWLPNGTDFPIEHIAPLYTFYAAVFRKDHNGKPEQGFQMENALSREETLRSMTIWAARGSFLEKQTGSLEPGKWADMVVTDKDIMVTPEKEILSTRVVKTFIAGEEVYSAP